MSYLLHRDVLSATEPLHVAVVGVGGTGSEIVSSLINLHLALRALGYAGLAVVAFDPDVVSEANIVRQRYAPSDIGRPKAEVLINRINLAYNLDWRGHQMRFAGDAAGESWDLVISCVDTRRSRAELHHAAFRERFGTWKFWVDTGNDHSTGQVIVGTPRSKRRRTLHMLPCSTELHPELRDVSIPDDEAPSCSAAEAITKQDLMVNKMVAVLAVDLLWRLFRDRKLDVHARYFDLESGATSARAVPAALPRRPSRRTTMAARCQPAA